MRKFSYWLCFSLVVFSCVYFLASMVMSALHVHPRFMTLLWLFTWFGSLVPPMAAPLVPRAVFLVLHLAMLALAGRRLWFLFAKREGIPVSFAGAPKVLAYVGAWSFTLSLIVLILSFLARAGSGIPAALISIPALLCIPWAFFLTEMLSLGKTGNRWAATQPLPLRPVAGNEFACPNCSASVTADAPECAECGALFKGAQSWKPVRKMARLAGN